MEKEKASGDDGMTIELIRGHQSFGQRNIIGYYMVFGKREKFNRMKEVARKKASIKKAKRDSLRKDRQETINFILSVHSK